MEDLSKLTIPKLKALCKEKKLSGYSKLNKPGLIAKLLEYQAFANGSGSSSTAMKVAAQPSMYGVAAEPTARNPSASSTLTAAPIVRPRRDSISTLGPSSRSAPSKPTPKPRTNKSKQDAGPSRPHTSGSIATSNHEAPQVPDPPTAAPATSLVASFRLPAEVEPLPALSPKPIKRKGDVPTVAPKAKRLKPVEKPPLGPTSATPKLPLPCPIPPVAKDGTLASRSTANVYGHSVNRPADVESTAKKANKKAFAPLVPRLPPAKVAPASNASVAPISELSIPDSCSVVSDTSFEFHTDDAPIVLRPATLPPLISQRKKVQKLSMLFSLLFEEDLATLCRLCRLYRYSAYISASHILRRDFAGSRLDAMFKKYSLNMVDYWPYLRKRRAEAKARRQHFGNSFLGRHLASFPCIVSPRLWACDDSQHLLIATKFLLTSFFYRVSIGLKVPFDSMSILSVDKVISGEIWKVTALHRSITQYYYILDATCEVVGLPSLSGHEVQAAVNPSRRSPLVRADWTAYIESKLRTENPCPVRLQDRLSWTNHEEYDHGISKNWINRVEREGETGLVKLTLARRYVLACLVANSLSGKHMTSVEMEQEFNGRMDAGAMHIWKARQRPDLSLFLPSHHSVESVHITSRRNKPLHPAVASVQTPGREYYILRDNALQIGTEEDGVCDVWMNILRCTSEGVAL